jgi:hypothetical protein
MLHPTYKIIINNLKYDACLNNKRYVTIQLLCQGETTLHHYKHKLAKAV